MGMPAGAADSQSAIWFGCSYMAPLIGGYISDTSLGRWKAIRVFFVIYLAGCVALTFSAFLDKEITGWLFFPAIYLCALGSGGMKPLNSAFGADQLDEDQHERYFNVLYWFQNLGACASFLGIVYVCQNMSFELGFFIAAFCLFVSFFVLMAGSETYTKAPPEGSKLGVVASVMGEACGGIFGNGGRGNTFLDRARKDFGGSHTNEDVDTVQQMGRIMPVFVLLVVYWGINGQMSTTFFNQGCQMDLHLGSFTVPVAALQLFNTIIIVLLVPVFDGLIYPWLHRIGYYPSTLTKMAWGMGLEVIVMLGAAWLEWERKQTIDAGGVAGPSVCFPSSGDGDVPMAASLSSQ